MILDRKSLRGAVIPALAACYPVLALTAQNSQLSLHLAGWLKPLCAAAAMGVFFWLLASLLAESDGKRTVLSLLAVIWFSAYILFEDAVRYLWDVPEWTERVALGVSLVVLALSIRVVRRTPRSLDGLALVMRRAVVLLSIFPIWTAIANRGPRASASSRQSEFVATSFVRDSANARPDIYLILLDKYTGSRSLQAHYGIDNGSFEQSLSERGFVLPSRPHANYVHTMPALAAMLNWTYLDSVLTGVGRRQQLGKVLALIDDNRATRFLKAQGYEVVFFPTTFPATLTMRLADQVLEPSGRPRRRAGLSIEATWVLQTPLSPVLRLIGEVTRTPVDRTALAVFPYVTESAEELRWKLRRLSSMPRSARPRFVFAHLLIPHEPYLFDADCSTREPFWPATDSGRAEPLLREAYVAQLRCTNRLMLEVVDSILAHSATPPIILLQSDHGHGRISSDPARGATFPLRTLPPDQVQERLDIFAAYHLPSGGASIIYDSITPINVLPSLFNYYFGTSFPREADRAFWSDYQELLRFTEVTHLGGGRDAATH